LSQPVTPNRAQAAALWTFAIASLLTIALGVVVMSQADVPLGIGLRNLIAWLGAAVAAIYLARRGWLTGWAAPVALGIIALSFAGPGQEGVHRWLDLGPIQLNAAALVLPAAIAASARERARLVIPCFALIAFALAWQPDISQLAGFAIAAVILCAARFGWKGAAGALALAAGAIAVCLSRPDPLEPVAHVEGIFALAWSPSPAIAIGMGVALAAASLSPLLVWRSPEARWSALALAAYFTVTATAFLFGAYPAPLAGYGLSFVTGWWVGAAGLSVPVSKRNAVNSLTAG
jgi:hypothetical protein